MEYVILPKLRFTVKRDASLKNAEKLVEPEVVAKMLKTHFGNSDREMTGVVCLDKTCKAVALFITGLGGSDNCSVSIRDMCRELLLCGAERFIFFHTHPAGTCVPSKHDVEVTDMIGKAAAVLGLRFDDHIIIANDSDEYYSFAEKDRLKYEAVRYTDDIDQVVIGKLL